MRLHLTIMAEQADVESQPQEWMTTLPLNSRQLTIYPLLTAVHTGTEAAYTCGAASADEICQMIVGKLEKKDHEPPYVQALVQPETDGNREQSHFRNTWECKH